MHASPLNTKKRNTKCSVFYIKKSKNYAATLVFFINFDFKLDALFL